MERDPEAVMEENHVNKNHWYLLTGLILGLAIGLVVSLLIFPAVNAEALPHELDESAKALYREQIALAFAANPDPNRAWSRLALLRDADPVGALINQAQNNLAQEGSVELSRSLVKLAESLQQLGLPTNP